jgi:phosphoribosylaminoimidazole carboxylase (NCAIR synthetase)
MDLSTIWPILGPVIIAIIASSAGWYANRLQLHKITSDAAANAKAAEIARDKAAADLSEQSLGIARSAAADVITIRVEMRQLRDENIVMKEQIRALTDDKRRLEEDKQLQGAKIAALEAENINLRSRVDLLENTMRESGVTIPNGK